MGVDFPEVFMNFILKFLLSTLLLSTLSSNCLADVLLKDTQGQSTAFSTLKGKWVVLNYWAGWCQSCVDEIPELNRFYQNHKNDPIALFAVNYDNLPLFRQKSLIKRFNIDYPNLLQDPANELRLGDITGIPVTFIFNPKGELVKKLFGPQTTETLDQVIAMK